MIEAVAQSTRLSIPTRMRNGQPVTAAEGRELVRSYRRTAAIRARAAGSKLAELYSYARRNPLTDRQLADVLLTARNMTRYAVAIARVAIDAATVQPAPRAYACSECLREQDIDGHCITCGAIVGKAA